MDRTKRRGELTIVLAGLSGCALLACFHPQPPHGPGLLPETLGVGLIIGTIFGQTTLAAMWCAWGPFRLAWRMPLSLAWVAGITAAFTFNLATEHPGPPELPAHEVPFAIALAASLLGQWMAVQVPLWILVVVYGVFVRPREQSAPTADPRLQQFGIRQLMILTAIVGVALGAGRAVVLHYASQVDFESPQVLIVVFLAAAAVVTTLPLIVAAWLPRGALLATVVVALLIALATVWEAPLLAAVDPAATRGGRDLPALFAATNAVMGSWICVFTFALRRSGYGLISVATSDRSCGSSPAVLHER